MATTKFNGPVNSLNGFQLNSKAQTIAGTKLILTAAIGSMALDAGVAGLSTVSKGFAQQVNMSASKMILACQPYASAASFQVRAYFSSDATVRGCVGDNAAATISVILIGTP